MTKSTGLGMRFLVGGYDISGTTAAFDTIRGGSATWDINDITQSAMARTGLARTGGIEVTTFYTGDAAGEAHERLSAMPTDDVHVMVMTAQTLGAPVLAAVGKQVTYDMSRPSDGSLLCKTTVESTDYGVEWGDLLTAGMRTDTAATNGSSVDFGAAGTNGLQMWLQATDFTGTSITLKLQQSSDNGGADAWADLAGAAFTAVSADNVTQRVAIAGNVERYLRLVSTGTFTTATFAVGVTVNATAVAF